MEADGISPATGEEETRPEITRLAGKAASSSEDEDRVIWEKALPPRNWGAESPFDLVVSLQPRLPPA